jgi:mandelate racemase
MRADSPKLTLRALTAIPVAAPMARPLGTAVQTISEAPLLLVDLETNEGITGRSYAFCYQNSIARSLQAVARDLSSALAGMPVHPLDLSQRISRHFRLVGTTGPLAMIASAIDVAAWDALATAVDLPLSTLLGSAPRPIAAYNSNGLGFMSPDDAALEAETLLGEGFQAVKLRIGRLDVNADLAVVRAVRKRMPDEALLMIDFNQALTFAEAMRRCSALDDEGVYWIEEPIRHDDYQHAALIAQAVTTPIQAGENFLGLEPLAASLSAAASDYVMLDLDRIGGVSGWRSAAGLAAAYGREVSSHLFPEVSAHLLAATPTAGWLEFVDWAAPVLQEPLRIVDGKAIPIPGPGVGLRWNESAVAKFRLSEA